jgi:hypothetical protein
MVAVSFICGENRSIQRKPLSVLFVEETGVPTFGTHTHNSKNFKLKKFNREQPAMSVTGTTIQAL